MAVLPEHSDLRGSIHIGASIPKRTDTPTGIQKYVGTDGLVVSASITTSINILSLPFISGLVLIITGTTSVSLALAWGGDKLPWNSYQVLVSLCVGFACLVTFFFVEFNMAKHPTVSSAAVGEKPHCINLHSLTDSSIYSQE